MTPLRLCPAYESYIAVPAIPYPGPGNIKGIIQPLMKFTTGDSLHPIVHPAHAGNILYKVFKLFSAGR
jgi:hypothetical protein